METVSPEYQKTSPLSTAAMPSHDEPLDSGRPLHRRGFFSEGLRHLMKPLAEIVEKRLDRVGLPLAGDELEREGRPPPVPVASPERPVLRPPGALDEPEFLERCLSSGQCVRVCPVSAIKWEQSADPKRQGKPFIDAQAQACVVCADLACMNACPSGALVPVPKEEIHMGLAVLDAGLCLRSHGEDCQICADKCPLGSRAISIPYPGASVEVHEPGCVGCGVCEMYCPVDPRAITVKPRPEGAPGSRPSREARPGESSSYLPLD
jgi:ferredoxin-type protein NapG